MTTAEAEALRPGDRVEITFKNDDPFGDPRTLTGTVVDKGPPLTVQWDQVSDVQLAPSVVTPAGVARLEHELRIGQPRLRLVPMPKEGG